MNRTSRTVAVAFRIGALMLPLSMYSPASALAQNHLIYDPATHTVAGTLPVSSSFNWRITSPESRRNDPSFPSATAELEVAVTSVPLGSSLAIAEGLVSLNQTSVAFSDYSQTKTLQVSVTAGSSTPPGDYTYILKAKVSNESDPKWGNGDGTVLTLSVAAPTATDTTPPNVSFDFPGQGSVFTYCAGGNLINVQVTAADAESVVTALYGSVNSSSANLALTPQSPNLLNTNTVIATGSFNAAGVGKYDLKAWATSAGGTSDKEASLQTVTVQYNLGWLPPVSLGKTGKAGSTMPIKFRSTDCLGAFVADTTVNVKVFKGTTASGSPLMNAFFGDGSTSVRISDLDEYIVNFQTQSTASDYLVQVYFNGVLHQSRTFSMR